MIDKQLGLAAVALAAGIIVWQAPPAKADHCFHLNSGMIYCYDSLPGHVIHPMWPADGVPTLPADQRWECNLMAHPRTICVSHAVGSLPPDIPKYTPGSAEFEARQGPGGASNQATTGVVAPGTINLAPTTQIPPAKK